MSWWFFIPLSAIIVKSLSGSTPPPQDPSIFFPDIKSNGSIFIFSLYEGWEANITFPYLLFIIEKPFSILFANPVASMHKSTPFGNIFSIW